MKQIQPQTIIFDLDGTLIDSSASILKCFGTVLSNAGIQPVVPLDCTLIGPPLRTTLMNISGLPAGEMVEQLAADFQNIYDTEGYKASLVYPGVDQLLSRLKLSGTSMAIATNKRKSPTLRILDYLGWNRYFSIAGTLDTPTPPHPHKAALIKCILEEMGQQPEWSLYVGDKCEDGEAAMANGMPFIAAGWGYGDWSGAGNAKGWCVADTAEELGRCLTP